ncbi:MAG: 50S ribosomal protein L10, partial [Candidatus Levyibacteriota bacterium]
KVEKSTAMFFVEYTGLTHKQLEEARQELSKANAEMAVVKNTLMNIALSEKKIDAKEKLVGQKATLFSYEDPIQTAKVLAAFIKKYGMPTISFGVYNDEIIDEGMITKLATLPSKEILVGKLLGLLNSPISGLVYVLNGNITKLALVLKEIEKKKAAAPEAPSAPAATPAEAAAPAPIEAAEAPVAEAETAPAAEEAIEAPAESTAEEVKEEAAPATTEAPAAESAEAEVKE